MFYDYKQYKTNPRITTVDYKFKSNKNSVNIKIHIIRSVN